MMPAADHYRQAWNNYCKFVADFWIGLMVPKVEKAPVEVDKAPKFTVVRSPESGEIK